MEISETKLRKHILSFLCRFFLWIYGIDWWFFCLLAEYTSCYYCTIWSIFSALCLMQILMIFILLLNYYCFCFDFVQHNRKKKNYGIYQPKKVIKNKIFRILYETLLHFIWDMLYFLPEHYKPRLRGSYSPIFMSLL